MKWQDFFRPDARKIVAAGGMLMAAALTMALVMLVGMDAELHGTLLTALIVIHTLFSPWLILSDFVPYEWAGVFFLIKIPLQLVYSYILACFAVRLVER